MNENEFQDRLDRYGGNFAAWPEDDRTAAMLLIAASAEAREILARHRAFENLFRVSDMPEPPSTAAIIAHATARPRRSGFRFGSWFALDPHRPLGWPQLAGLVACAAIGFVLGVAELRHNPLSPELLDYVDGSTPELIDE
jgi:hypothetical protein